MRPKDWIAIGVLCVLAAAAGFYVSLGKPRTSGGARPAVVELYLAEAAQRGDPRGIHVADVAVDASGGVSLSASADPAVEKKVGAALSDLRTQTDLSLLDDGVEGPGPQAAHTLAEARVAPGDPRYAWAVGGFLRARTGLNYQIAPSKP